MLPSSPYLLGTRRPYQGPGNLASGWVAWGGMRAFSTATAATPTNAIELRYSDATTVTYQTQPDGTINLQLGSNGGSHAQNIISHGGPATVRTWYDQSGNGRNLTNALAVQQPTFTLNARGTFPGTTANTHLLSSVSNITLAQPFSLVLVASMPASMSQVATIFGRGTGGVGIGAANTPDKWYNYWGGTASEDALFTPSAAFHSATAIANGTASNMYFDGVDHATGADVGTQGYSSEAIVLCADTGGSNAFSGVILEWGVFAGNISSVRSAIYSNQKSIYGL